MPTKQETFDTIVAHLRKQNARSTSGFGCKYRGPNGRKCAVGILIPDDKYKQDMEQCNCDIVHIATLLEQLGHDVPLCRDMQTVHDHFNIPDWESHFRVIAEKHNITYTEPANADQTANV